MDRADAVVQALRQNAQPILRIQEGEIALEKAVEPQSRELRWFVVLRETLEIGSAKTDAHGPEIAEIRETEDQQTVEFRVVRIAFEKRARVGSDDGGLHRAGRR